jgi:hypothetical protein
LATFQAEAKQGRRRSGSIEGMRFPAQEAGTGENEEDVFDPFADFSEFESNRDEEEDLNFFKNGRMLTLGFQGGMTNFTKEMAEKYQSTFRYGLFISYFFDLNFAIQLHWHSADAPIAYRSLIDTRTGNASFSNLGFSVKYFLNTQNVTKGLANLNPYFLVGMSNYARTIRFGSINGSIKDSSTGFNGGMGIEVPMMRKKLFWGLQLNYDLVSFKDENIPEVIEGNNYGTAKGDMWNVIGTVGINF